MTNNEKEWGNKRQNESQRRRRGRREVKSTLFAKLFEDDQSKIELFNALTGADFGPDTEVLEVTLDDVLYHGKKNDLGFIIASRFLILDEHQSTINENMPMRELQYAARTYEAITAASDLYKEKLIKVPMPEFFVIYTGEKPWNKEYLRLSDSFMVSPVENSMELVVKVIDIRYNRDEINPVLEKSEKLKGYSILLSYLSEAKKEGYGETEAIDIALERCIQEGILVDFIRRNSSEMGSFLYHDITVEEFIELRAEERAEELVEERAQKLAAERIPKLVEERVQDMAKDLAQDMAKDLAQDMAKDMVEERAQDMAKDMVEERAQDMAKELAMDLAKTMKSKGYDIADIIELTKLSKEEIEKL